MGREEVATLKLSFTPACLPAEEQKGERWLLHSHLAHQPAESTSPTERFPLSFHWLSEGSGKAIEGQGDITTFSDIILLPFMPPSKLLYFGAASSATNINQYKLHLQTLTAQKTVW